MGAEPSNRPKSGIFPFQLSGNKSKLENKDQKVDSGGRRRGGVWEGREGGEGRGEGGEGGGRRGGGEIGREERRGRAAAVP